MVCREYYWPAKLEEGLYKVLDADHIRWVYYLVFGVVRISVVYRFILLNAFKFQECRI